MNKKYLAYAILPILGLSLLGIGTASAHGMMGFGGTKATPEEISQNQTDRFIKEAQILGLSVDEVKNSWAKGQTLQDLAKEKGISQDTLNQKMTDLRKQQIQDQLQNLVSKGVITQAQADQRLKVMQDKIANGPKGGASGHEGRGHGMPHMMGF